MGLPQNGPVGLGERAEDLGTLGGKWKPLSVGTQKYLGVGAWSRGVLIWIVELP